MKLNNKVVVITGAAGGFGRALVELFCGKHCTVFALDIDAKGLKVLKGMLSDKGFDIKTAIVDVTSLNHWRKFAALLTRAGETPDVWINNAGIAYPDAFHRIDPVLFNKILAVNLNGVINGTRIALQFMLPRQSGLIVNVASCAGHIPSPFLTPYAAAKHGVVGFTRSLKLELAQQGAPIKMCLVSPGFSDTDIMKANRGFKFPKWLSWSVSTPQEIAGEILAAVENGADEIFPGMSASGMLGLYRYAPSGIFNLVSRLLTARNLKELIGMEGIRARE